MSRDCFVTWKDEKPSLADIETNLKEYLNGAEVSIECKGKKSDWWFISLHGKNTFADARQGDPERWFEVCAVSIATHVDIITRMQDTYTNDVATGFAKLLERRYQAKITE